MVRTIFDDNKQNLETYLQNLLIPLANEYLNELTLADLLGLIGGSGGDSDESGGPHIDPDTGKLICFPYETEEPSTTTETIPSFETSTSANPTHPDEITTVTDEQTTITSTEYEKNESTTLQVPDDVPNSSNFFFHKFQVMIFTVSSIISLRIL